MKSSVRGNYGGILLSDITGGQNTAEFVAFTTRALQLIEQADPRRFRRIQRELRYIANAPLLAGAVYQRQTRACKIDFLRFYPFSDEPAVEWYLAAYAGVLVHEATHGRLHRHSVPYNDKTWMRAERLCHSEETRFATRLKSENYDFATLIPKFDPRQWEKHRKQSYFQKLKMMLARMREVEAQQKR